MKYRVLYIVALFALILSSCRQAPEEMKPEASLLGEEHVVTAICGNPATPATKTSRDADGNMYWEPGDEIGLFVGWQAGRKNEAAMKFTAQLESRQSTADFSGTLTDIGLEYWTGPGNEYHHLAIYPYNEDVRLQGNGPYSYDFEFTGIAMPDVQEGIPGTFDRRAFVSVASSDDDQFTFHHPMGGLKFSIQSEGVTKVTLVDPDDITKTSTVALLDSAICVTAKSDGEAYVSGAYYPRYGKLQLIPKGGGTFIPGESYYFVCEPGEHRHGIQLILEREDGSTLTRVYSNKVTFKKATFAALMNADQGCEWKSALPVVDQSIFNMGNCGGQVVFNVTAGQDYEVEFDADWLINRSAVGDPVAGTRTHTFVVKRNFGAERTAEIKLINAFGTVEITVNQEAGEVWPDYPTITRHHCIFNFGSFKGSGPLSHCNLVKDAKDHFGDEVEYISFFNDNVYFDTPYTHEPNQYHWESANSSALIDGRRWISIGPSSSEVRFQDIYDYKEETDALYPPLTSIGLSSDFGGFGITVNMNIYAYQEGNYQIVVYLSRKTVNPANIAGRFRNVFEVQITEDEVNWHDHIPGATRHLVKGNNPLQFTTTVTGYNQPLDPQYFTIFAYVLAPYGDQPVVRDNGLSFQSGDFYGSYYVDNCRMVNAGESVDYEVVQ